MRLPTRGIDYTNKDYEAFRAEMIRGLKETMPEYTDLSQTDAGIVIMEQLAKGLDVLSFHQDIYANEAFFLTAKSRETGVRWSAGLGYVPKNRTSAVHEQVFMLTRILDDDFVIARGTKVKTKETALEKSVIFELIEDLIIPSGNLGVEFDSATGLYLYSVPVRQGVTIYEDHIGSSTGLPNQTFKLSYRFGIPATIQVYVNEGGGYIKWEQVKNFIDSKKTDRHYFVTVDEFDEVTIHFGDNFSGKIPDEYISGIYATYTVGGGVIGNVVPMSICELDVSIAQIAKTFNPYTEYTPGSDKETLDEIKHNAPAYLRTLWRAVTLQDHEDLLLINFGQVKFAQAVQDPYDRNNAIIYVMLRQNAPLTIGFRDELLSFFDTRKMVGNSVWIMPPNYYELDLEVTLWVQDDFNKEGVKDNVEEAVTEYFKLGEYPFNTELILATFEAEIIRDIRGVRSFRITSPLTDIIKPEETQVIRLRNLVLNVFGGVE